MGKSRLPYQPGQQLKVVKSGNCTLASPDGREWVGETVVIVSCAMISGCWRCFVTPMGGPETVRFWVDGDALQPVTPEEKQLPLISSETADQLALSLWSILGMEDLLPPSFAQLELFRKGVMAASHPDSKHAPKVLRALDALGRYVAELEGDGGN